MSDRHEQESRPVPARLDSPVEPLAHEGPPDVATALGDLTVSEQTAHRLASIAASQKQAYENILNTKTFRYASALRTIYRHLRTLRHTRDLPKLVRDFRNARRDSTDPDAPIPTPLPDVVQNYGLWIDLFDVVDKKRIEARLAALPAHPLVSLVLCVEDASLHHVKASVDAVQAQIYPRWELLVAADDQCEPQVHKLLSRYARSDGRIEVIGGLAGTGVRATLDLRETFGRARGEWVALLGADGDLAPHALALAMLAVAEQSSARVIYTDEDSWDSDERRHSPNFKPEFDPLLLLEQNYLRHLVLVQLDLALAIAKGVERLQPNFDWDLALRITEIVDPEHIVHIPHVLFHAHADENGTPGPAGVAPQTELGTTVVRDHLARVGRKATVSTVASSAQNRVTWQLPDNPPLVTIVVPTRDGSLLPTCIHSVLDATTYPNFELVVVDNGSTKTTTLELLRSLDGVITVIRDERPFNYSALNNAAVRQTSGGVICLLNDDTEIVTPAWLDEMVGQLFQPRVGAVGAKLLYDDGRIQHAGIVVGMGGVAGHPGRRTDGSSPGFAGRLDITRTVCAVTGACMVVRRAAWEEVGGLEEDHLAVAFNDVDFCLRLGEAGWRVVWTPYAELVHHESISRGSENHRLQEFAAENDYMRVRWGMQLRNDRAYNPNLSLATEDGSLAWPPRIPGGRL